MAVNAKGKENGTKMTQKRRTTHKKTSRKGAKKGSTSIFSRLRSIPLWGVIAGGAGVLAIYCYILIHFFVDPYSFQWKAIYGETVYPQGYNVRGIDISHYQQEISWQKLRNANMDKDPVTFVIIKATEGNTIIDEYFNDNFYQARQNDFVRGAYHFLTPYVPARKQAEFFLRQVHLTKGDLPPVLDVENEKKWKDAGKDKQQIQKMVLEWLQTVEKEYHTKPILYSSYKFRHDILTDSVFNRYPFWMAHYYVEKPRQDIEWKFWQHTDCGQLPGIKGLVDCNIFNGDRSQFDSLLIKEDREP